MTWRPWLWILAPATLPLVVVSLLLAIPYGVQSAHVRGRCIELISRRPLWGRAIAQSLGCPVIWYRDVYAWDDDAIRVHERCHVVQGILMLGIPFVIAYGASFAWNWARLRRYGWQAAYFEIWAEQQAFRIEREFAEGKRPDAWR